MNGKSFLEKIIEKKAQHIIIEWKFNSLIVLRNISERFYSMLSKHAIQNSSEDEREDYTFYVFYKLYAFYSIQIISNKWNAKYKS